MNKKKRDEVICDVVERLCVLSTSEAGWTKELNRISWNGGDPKFDIRTWAPDREKFTKGITLSTDETKALLSGLVEYFNENEE